MCLQSIKFIRRHHVEEEKISVKINLTQKQMTSKAKISIMHGINNPDIVYRDSELWEGIWGSFYAVSTTRAHNTCTFVWVQQRPLLTFCYSR